jgi:hypothetical protein
MRRDSGKFGATETSPIVDNNLERKIKGDTMNQDPRFQYVHSSRRRNPIVVAYNAQTVESGEIVVRLAVSFCSENDRFNRTLGRSIAAGRLQKRSYNFQVSPGEGESFNQAVTRGINREVSRNQHKIMNTFKEGPLCQVVAKVHLIDGTSDDLIL